MSSLLFSHGLRASTILVETQMDSATERRYHNICHSEDQYFISSLFLCSTAILSSTAGAFIFGDYSSANSLSRIASAPFCFKQPAQLHIHEQRPLTLFRIDNVFEISSTISLNR